MGPHSSGGVPLSKLIVSGCMFKNAEKALSGVDLNCVTSLDLSGSLSNSFDFLEKLENLEHLNLGFCGITDTTLETVAKNGDALRYLDLKHTKVTSNGISVLAGAVPKLEFLSLASTMIDDSALSYISMMPSLQTLDLSQTRIKGFFLILLFIFFIRYGYLQITKGVVVYPCQVICTKATIQLRCHLLVGLWT